MKKNRTKRILTLTTAAVVGLAMSCAPVFGAGKNVKDETVYVITDGSGTATETIVSDHLINKTNAGKLTDESNLTGIENVKGDETFKKDGNTLTWDAKGSDIYYQGHTDKSVPVSLDVKYYLDGKKVTGRDLQGRSGDVKIVIDYANDAEVGGKKVPFVVMTGFIADKETFHDIEIDNGKVIDNGNDSIVVGMAVPGLKEDLGIETDEIPLGDSVTITGTADGFDCEDMMTVVTNNIYEDIDTGAIDDLDLDDEVDQLDKAGRKLVEGTQELYDGIDYMYSQTDALQEGVGKLNKGAQDVSGGTSAVRKNTKKLAGGAGDLASGMRELKIGVSTAKAGAKHLYGGLAQVQAGVNGDGTASDPGLVKGASSLTKGAGDLVTGIGSLETGAEGISEGAGSLAEGAQALESGVSKVDQGARQVADGIGGVSSYADAGVRAIEEAKSDLEGMKDSMDPDDYSKLMGSLDSALTAAKTSAGGLDGLKEGAQEVAGGAGSLKDGVSALKTGAESLRDGAGKLRDGAEDAKAGAETLRSGASQVEAGLETVQAGLDGTEDQTGLVDGAKQLYAGLDEATGGTGELSDGADKLAQGTKQLDDGVATLDQGAKTLADGMETFDESTVTLVEGIGLLDEGSSKLKKGMSRYYKEGIRKLVDMYEGDLKGLASDLDGVMKAGKDYDRFTQVSGDMDSSVHFVYKTEIAK